MDIEVLSQTAGSLTGPANTKSEAKLQNPTAPQQSLTAPNISHFLDFRKYLQSFYEYRRLQTAKSLRPFSYATFSAAAGIKSPNYLKMIIDGDRNLSLDTIDKFAKALHLTKDQTDEFRWMVLYLQADEPAQRNLYLKELMSHRVKAKIKLGELNEDVWHRIPSWVSWILYTLTDQENVSFDLNHLRDIFRNQISQDDIKFALNKMLERGDLVKDEATGTIKKAATPIPQAEDIPVELVRKLQAELMTLGLESLYRDAPTEREFGTATLCLTKEEFEEVRFQLRKLRKDVQKNTAVNRASKPGDRVYQLNLQLFPLTDKSAI